VQDIPPRSSEHNPEQRNRQAVDRVEGVWNHSTPSITITAIILIVVTVAAGALAAFGIASSFEARGIIVATAVVGGAGLAFALSVIARIVLVEVISALRLSRQARELSENDPGSRSRT